MVIKCKGCARLHSERLSSKPVFTESGQNVRYFIVQCGGGLHKAPFDHSESAVFCEGRRKAAAFRAKINTGTCRSLMSQFKEDMLTFLGL